MLDVAVQAGVVKRSGAFFAYRDERLGQGRAKAMAFLDERPDLVEAIRSAAHSQKEGSEDAAEM